MNVQAFYKALAKVLAEKTNVNINNWDISDEEALLFDVSEEERKAIKERRPF